jgi:hypothetical protein
MHDIAALAAAMEDLVSRESRSRLTMAFDTHNHLQDAVLNRSVMKAIVDDYAVLYMSAWNMKNLTSEAVDRTEAIRFKQGYWRDSWAPWLEKLIDGFVEKADESSRDASFTALAKVGDAIGKGFHKINDAECAELKGVFMSFESKVPGRVRLSDFYGKSVVNKWAFREKPEYLRAMGALDETNKSDPKVIYTNYITSMPQCVPVSSLYSVCCPNECETMLDKLESKIVAPGSDPDHIAKLVSSLSSSTVSAPRTLSESLLARLHEIAAVHGGWIPLHGRLFALWMHHAFPRDCPYPHQSGQVSPLTADEWMQETDSVDTQVTAAEMRKHTTAERSCPPTGCGEESPDQLPWDDLEELIHHTAANHTTEASVTAADLAADAAQNPLIYRDMIAPGAGAAASQKRTESEPVAPKIADSSIPKSDIASKKTNDVDRSRIEGKRTVDIKPAEKKQLLAEVSAKQIPEDLTRGEAELKRLLQESEKFVNTTAPGPSSSFGWTFLRAVFVGILALLATVVLRTVLKTQAAKKKKVYYDDASSDKFV